MRIRYHRRRLDMTNLRFHNLVRVALLHFGLQGCDDVNSLERVSVSLKNTETYQYPAFVGDEEGASISTQAKHYSISEVRRDSTTNWDAVYFYQPAASFVGSDYAAIRIYTGSDGASPNTNIKEVRFYFAIHN